jgi:hypothetical protein
MHAILLLLFSMLLTLCCSESITRVSQVLFDSKHITRVFYFMINQTETPSIIVPLASLTLQHDTR